MANTHVIGVFSKLHSETLKKHIQNKSDFFLICIFSIF